jgi:hypothetical protein
MVDEQIRRGLEESDTLAGTDHVSSVHFIITDPSTKDTFNALKRNLVAT